MTHRLEADEQADVVLWLERHDVAFTATANGAMLAGRSRGARMTSWGKLQRLGVRQGVPDLLIFTPPPAQPAARGVAIEMKRKRGGRVEPLQSWWQGRLLDCDWVAEVAHGAEDAIRLLKGLGYGQ